MVPATRRFVLLPTLAAAVLACSSAEDAGQWTKPTKTSAPARVAVQERQGPVVEVGGCVTVLGPPTGPIECIYEPGQTLRLWVVHDPGDTPMITARTGDTWSPLSAREDDHYDQPGRGYRPLLPGPALESLRVELPAEQGGRVWGLALRSTERLAPDERSARDTLSKTTRSLERRLVNGDETAIGEYHRVVQDALAKGLLGDAINLALGASFRITWSIERPDLALRFLERLQPAAERFSEGRAGIAIYLAHALRRRGRLVEAATAYRRGGQLALAIGDTGLSFDALAPYAHVLAELGYVEAAAHWIVWVNRLAHAYAGPRDRALLLALIGSTDLRLQSGKRTQEDPEGLLREVLATHPAGGNQARLGLAEFATQRGDHTEALRRLDQLDQARLTIDSHAHAVDIRMRALLSSAGTADAAVLRSSLVTLTALERDAVGPHHRWRAAVLRGRVHEALGERSEAAAAYEDSEVLLDEMIPLTALGVPGNGTATRHREGTERLVALQVGDNQFEAALCTVRRAQARMAQLGLLHQRLDEADRENLRSRVSRYTDAVVAYERLLDLDAREWAASKHEGAKLEAERRRRELSRDAFEILSARGAAWGRPQCEQLRAREPNEHLLALFPLGEDLHVFDSDERGVTHRVLPKYFSAAVTPESSAQLLLEPIAPRLRRASRVRVLASGRAVAIPVHALPWLHGDSGREHKPLVMAIPVVYGLELPPHADTRSDKHNALVLTDQRNPVTAGEKSRLAGLLGAAGWQVEAIGSDERMASQAREAVAATDHFHYEGHAYYADPAGELEAHRDEARDRFRRWPPYAGGAASEPSFIPLGEFGRLSVPDILMMTRVPRTAVLLGCRTGIMDDRVGHGGFSLATAFLGAGSEAVVASTAQVEAEGAALLGRALYSNAGVVPADPGQWLTDAWRVIDVSDQPSLRVEDYRVFVR